MGVLGDSGEMPDNRCSNCLQAGLECSHKEVTKVRFKPALLSEDRGRLRS